jgi:hypothetical protein
MNAAAWSQWTGRWEEALTAARRRGGEDHAAPALQPPGLIIEPPASEEDLRVVEDDLGMAVPPSFRSVLSGFSAHVHFIWAVPYESRSLPHWGNCEWNLGDLVRLRAEWRKWIDVVFPDPSDRYDAVWHEKFPIMEVPNGDMIAIDQRSLDDESVIYLSHEDGQAMASYSAATSWTSSVGGQGSAVQARRIGSGCSSAAPR